MGLHFYIFTLISLLVLHTPSQSRITAGAGTPILCHVNDSLALLEFNQSITVANYTSRSLSSYPKTLTWSSNDCCLWYGVTCDEDTGHVIGLDLGSSFIYGVLDSNSSIFRLSYLRNLSLADNYFSYSPIPAAIGKLSLLNYLNLSLSAVSGQIPSEVSRLTELTSLDLSLNPGLELRIPSLGDLIQNMTGLRELHLSMVDISSTVPEALANFTSLTSLALKECRLQGEFPAGIFLLPDLQTLSLRFNRNLTGHIPEYQNKSSLKSLRLAGTSFSGNLPNSIRNLNSLNDLDLSSCNFSGSIPFQFGHFPDLAHLNLSSNNFEGEIPYSFSNFTRLVYMDLSHNNFKGPIPAGVATLRQLSFLSFANNNFSCENLHSLGKLTKLVILILDMNTFNCDIPTSFANLTQLEVLAIQSSKLTGIIPSWLGNLTALTALAMRSNLMHGPVPDSIFKLKNLQILSLVDNYLTGIVKLDMLLQLRNLTTVQLSGTQLSLIPNSVSNFTFPQIRHLELALCNLLEFPDFLKNQSELRMLNLGHNRIQGFIPRWIWNMSTETLYSIFLDHNLLTGFDQLPKILLWKNLGNLDLSSNMLQGHLPVPPPSTFAYNISNNNLTGEIPPSFCNLTSIYELDLSLNNLNGQIPECSGGFVDSVSLLNLGGNNLEGSIPRLYNDSSNLRMIDLSQNFLQGRIPRSLAKCSLLESLDLGNNLINEIFPFWLGALPELKVLILRSNQFYGTIKSPESNFSFPKLRIIDLSLNDFSGDLPRDYFQTWNAMKYVDNGQFEYLQTKKEIDNPKQNWVGRGYKWNMDYNYSATIINKGVEMHYSRILNTLTLIDLSSNNFEGEIPESIGNLKGLNMLNLSHNNLSGHIPSSISNLLVLESLDLSDNKLSGRIPQQLTQLTFLSTLNVSGNNLTGTIPRGNQFNTYSNDSFGGNPGLCGVPLSKSCGGSSSPTPSSSSKKDDDDEKFPSKIDLIVICTGYGSGLIVGLVIGRFLVVWKHEWFTSLRRTKRQQQRRMRRTMRQRD